MNEKECPIPEPFSRMVGNILFVTGLFFLTFIGRFVFAPLMPTIEQDMGLSHSQAGSLFLMVSLGVFSASLMSGFVSNRFKHRGSLFLSNIGVGIALISIYFTTSLWALRGLMLLLGIAAGLHIPSAIATITAMVSRSDWGKALSVHQTAPALSLVSGPLLAVVLMRWFPWQMILVIIGCASLLVALLFRRFCVCGDFLGDVPRPSIVKEVISGRSFWIMVALFTAGIGGNVGLYAMMPLYLVTERGLEREWANTLVGLSQISGLFMAFISGWVTDRVGAKRAIFAVLLISGIATILLGMPIGAWLIVILFIQPALIFCYFPAGFSALSRIVQPNLRSTAAAWGPPLAFVLGAGGIPAAIGYMGQTYSFSLGIILIGFLMCLGSGLAFFLRLIEEMGEGC